MSLVFFGWILIVSSIVIPTLVVFSRSEQLPLDIVARLKPLKRTEAQSEAARSALLSRLRSASRSSARSLRDYSGTTGLAGAVFLLVTAIGAATFYVRDPPEAAGSEDTDDRLLARLQDYTRSVGSKEPESTAAAGELLPDVNTMTERLAARLETTPNDVQGWRMLGWSYFNTGRYDRAADAYARAVELDPSSDEFKRSYAEAGAKASESNNLETTPSSQAEPVAKGREGPAAEEIAKSEAVTPHQGNAAIRSMVDGLADRLESSPRDVEGWTRLMRSRVVLGERELAATALRKALDVFKDDSEASGQIAAAAIELGLTGE
jgi:cytochrome c-type biogenesis protein CcmH/NrfG